MNKVILMAAIATALVFSSCSSDSGDDSDSKSSSGSKGKSSSGGSGNNSSGEDSGGNSSGGGNKSSSSSGSGTEIYKLVELTDNYFTYSEEIKGYYCNDGVLEETKDSSEKIVSYSIEDNTLNWYPFGSDDDPFVFNGTSNELTGGAWTKKKGDGKDFCGASPWGDKTCLDGYDITKALFTDETIAITRDYCPTDSYYEDPYNEANGISVEIVNCNKAKLIKGTDEIIHTLTKSGFTYSYKNITCTYEYDPPLSEKKKACKDAWTAGGEDDNYYDVLYKEFDECMSKLPDFYSDGDGDDEDGDGEGDGDGEEGGDEEDDEYEDDGNYSAKLAAKPVAKVNAKSKIKFTWLLKKRK